MSNILDDLFYQHGLTQDKDKAALQRIATNTGMLKKDLNKWQKKRFLRIIDDKNLLADQQANDSFASGVRFGVLLMVEVCKKTNTAIDA